MVELLGLAKAQPIQELESHFTNITKLKDVINNTTEILQSNLPVTMSKLGTVETFIHASSENAIFSVVNARKLIYRLL